METPARTTSEITYIHNKPASFKSRILQTLMMILDKKNVIERSFKVNKFGLGPAPFPHQLQSDFLMRESKVCGRNVWEIKSKERISSGLILYIHGGGYIYNLTKYDWDFIRELLLKTNSTIVMPDYPLAPQSNYKDVYSFFDELYANILSRNPAATIAFVGNSAGGGVALGLSQKLRNEHKPHPGI